MSCGWNDEGILGGTAPLEPPSIRHESDEPSITFHTLPLPVVRSRAQSKARPAVARDGGRPPLAGATDHDHRRIHASRVPHLLPDRLWLDPLSRPPHHHRVMPTADPERQRPHDAFHYFFRDAAWKADRLWRSQTLPLITALCAPVSAHVSGPLAASGRMRPLRLCRRRPWAP